LYSSKHASHVNGAIAFLAITNKLKNCTAQVGELKNWIQSLEVQFLTLKLEEISFKSTQSGQRLTSKSAFKILLKSKGAEASLTIFTHSKVTIFTREGTPQQVVCYTQQSSSGANKEEWWHTSSSPV
jgi:hypothetical protein